MMDRPMLLHRAFPSVVVVLEYEEDPQSIIQHKHTHNEASTIFQRPMQSTLWWLLRTIVPSCLDIYYTKSHQAPPRSRQMDSKPPGDTRDHGLGPSAKGKVRFGRKSATASLRHLLHSLTFCWNGKAMDRMGLRDKVWEEKATTTTTLFMSH